MDIMHEDNEMKILVADDSKTTRALIASSLQKLGHEVILAANGQEAIVIYQTERIDLVILDVVMEEMDGFECARRIRSIVTENWIPIIFLSGTVDDENIANGINAGGDDYITKPYSEVTLAAKIKAMQRIADMRNNLYSTTQALVTLSSTDPLTHLNNRLQFDKTIKEKISYANHYNKMFVLLFIDLDHFKAINDSLGHYVGDELLKEVAQRLQACLRSSDFIARIGGDEFAVIITDIGTAEVVDEIAKKILMSLHGSYNLAGNDLSISCSIGIALYSIEDNISLETFINNADLAMYYAKESGRNNYKYYNTKLNKKHDAQVNLENALKYAVENNELYLEYQPILDLSTNKIIRMEVLTSWRNPKLGRVSANQFIPMAEEIGCIDSLSLWILRTACQQSANWNLQEKGFKLSINISPRQLMQKNLQEHIISILKDSHVPFNNLEFELTETSPLIYSKLYEEILIKIHDIGINICLDDFGTSYSSLSHLRNLPISAIKIDRSFLKEIMVNKKDAMLVKSIITLGNNLGFDVIAEGIETREQLEFLINNGCKQGQGYYLCKPKSFEEITKLIEKQKTLPSMNV